MQQEMRWNQIGQSLDSRIRVEWQKMQMQFTETRAAARVFLFDPLLRWCRRQRERREQKGRWVRENAQANGVKRLNNRSPFILSDTHTHSHSAQKMERKSIQGC